MDQPAADRYAARRLNPFSGLTEVVDAGTARALSHDGVHWEIQVLAESPSHTWGRDRPGQQPVLRYFRYGHWQARSGLRDIPANPVLDIGAMTRGAEALLPLLEASLPHLPFPLRDNIELWALDGDRQPLALLASTIRPEFTGEIRPGPWHGSDLTGDHFCSQRLASAGYADADDYCPRRHAEMLDAQIRQRSGALSNRRWYRRLANGGGEALEGGPPLPADAFPPLLLNEHWQGELEQLVVEEYLEWLAPLLLTLPTLDDERRARLEQAARRRPELIERNFRLYPKMVDPEFLNSARVELRLRATRHNG